ncbi:MAG: TonB-dependent receptor [Gammaproteobacteria bacterium]
MKFLSVAGSSGVLLPFAFVSSFVSFQSIAADELEEVVVTANRIARSVDATLTPVTVITREDIQKYQATQLTDVLRRVPGLNITNSGGSGKVSSAFFRGTNSGHVLVLIDGVRHGSATVGATAFEHIPLDQIERIEIVRGPRSSLYGSEAIGGVIQIFTRKGGKGFQPSLEFVTGSHSSIQARANVSGGDQSSWYNLNLQGEKTNAIDSCNSTTAGCFADEPDKDGYRRTSFSVHAGRRLSDSLVGDFSFTHAKGFTEFDGDFQNQSKVLQQVISGKLAYELNDQVNLSLQLGRSRDESDNFKDKVPAGRFDNQRDTVTLLADIGMTENQTLLFGLDWYEDQVDSTTDYDEKARDNQAVFASYAGEFGNTLLEASLRYDDNEQFGDTTTGAIAIGQHITDDITIKASYGTAFKAPTFNQLYFPGFGNADLDPEESENLELGIDGKMDSGRWEVNLFQNDIENLIAGFPVNNVGKVRIRGLEAIINTQLMGVDVAVNVTVQEPEVRTGQSSGKQLIERPEKLFNLDMDRRFGKWSLGATAHAESKRYSDAANSDELDSFTTVDVRTAYQFAKDWRLSLSLNNVLDEEYATKKGYNQDGRNALVSVRFAPD